MITNQILWDRRWKAINNVLELIQIRYEKAFQEEDAVKRDFTIFATLYQLQLFGKAQFHFFHDGFFTKQIFDLAEIPQNDRTFQLPHYIACHSFEEHVLYRTLDQIAEDAVVIQRASEQRIISIQQAEDDNQDPEKAPFTLVDIDKLTYSALRSVNDYLANPRETVLTYFQKSANVRVIPYAPVAMIGIPITSVGLHMGHGVAEDLLVIPHEVAHHLYWNGKANTNQTIQRALTQKIGGNSVRRWTEEIFADVVGCLIGGPAVARRFTELQLTVIGTAFIDPNTAYPTPALRPLLLAYALDVMGHACIANELRTLWETRLSERMVYVNRAHLFAGYQIVDAVFAIINHHQIPACMYWSNGQAQYDELYEQFTNRIPDLVNCVNENDLDPENLNIQTSWRDMMMNVLGKSELDDLPEDWTEAINSNNIQAAGRVNPISVDAAAWLRIYDFGGWITAGPQGGNASGDPLPPPPPPSPLQQM
ncbi:MAG: hypothetical protein AAF639_04865 [Chloroflexota bacterium]